MKKTFKFTTPAGRVFKRQSEKDYSHVVLHIKNGVTAVGSWHTSAALAEKKIRSLRTCVGRAHFADSELVAAPVDAEKPAGPAYHSTAAMVGRLLLAPLRANKMP